MAINKVVIGDEVKLDLTADTVVADKLLKGYTAHDKSGTKITGTYEGGSVPTPTDDTSVIFADYDGTLIDTWTWDERSAKTALPTVPAHEGLVFEGWNWTLEDIQTDTTGQVITVGPFYHTESGYSEFDVIVSKERGMSGGLNTDKRRYAYIDWGDGTIIDTPSDAPAQTRVSAAAEILRQNVRYTEITDIMQKLDELEAWKEAQER